MSVGARGVFNAAYAPMLFDVGRVPFPDDDPQSTLDALQADKDVQLTVLVIAHRESTLEAADQRVALREGKAVRVK